MSRSEHAWDRWPPRDPALAAGFDLWRSGDLGAAEAFFRARPATHEVQRGLGCVLWSQKRFQEARAAYSQAIRLAPRETIHWHNLGLVLRDLAQYPAALAAFDVALGLEPDYEPAWNERANVLFDMGRYAEALPLYHRALELNDSRAVVHHNLGMCLVALGQIDAARAAFDAALARDSGYGWSLQMQARLAEGAGREKLAFEPLG